jgi:hypothetical protein
MCLPGNLEQQVWLYWALSMPPLSPHPGTLQSRAGPAAQCAVAANTHVTTRRHPRSTFPNTQPTTKTHITLNLATPSMRCGGSLCTFTYAMVFRHKSSGRSASRELPASQWQWEAGTPSVKSRRLPKGTLSSAASPFSGRVNIPTIKTE